MALQSTCMPESSFSFIQLLVSNGQWKTWIVVERPNVVSLHFINPSYYMTDSASGQDESNPALYFVTRAGKIWSYLTRSGVPAASRKNNFLESHIINLLLTKFIRSRWLDIILVLFCEFMDLDSVLSLWTEKESRSINTEKKNLANIQPSWPHTWSITHTYIPTATISGHFGFVSLIGRRIKRNYYYRDAIFFLNVFKSSANFKMSQF